VDKKLVSLITLSLSLAVLGPATVSLVNAQESQGANRQQKPGDQPRQQPGQQPGQQSGPQQGQTPASGERPGEQGVGREGQPPGQSFERGQTVDIGATVPDFTLRALDGSEHSLSQHRGQVVVLEFINADDPFMAKHHVTNTTIPDLVEDYRESGVSWFAVASGAAANPDKLRAQIGAWKIDYPVLLDTDKRLASLLGARTSTQVFVIGKDGRLMYSGAIDDDKSQDEVGGTNFLKKALDAVLEGEELETPKTDPYGAPIE
jgi:peroxiredoxin